ncbi:hypothetical protein CGZ80_23570 [Rhodopirellula sp. MGV]|nr:hypothetical protein CGZ80_23570 [Rhodopirellula sp. MGV]
MSILPEFALRSAQPFQPKLPIRSKVRDSLTRGGGTAMPVHRRRVTLQRTLWKQPSTKPTDGLRQDDARAE